MDGAFADYRTAMRLDASIYGRIYDHGIQMLEEDDYDQALKAFGIAIRLDPVDASAYNCRGTAWSGRKEYDKAIEDFSAAIRVNPGNPFLYENRGFAWEHKGEYGNAIEDYSAAIRLDPDMGSSLIKIAWLLATCPDSRIRDGVEAIRRAQKACEVFEWKHNILFNTLAAAHAEAGDFEKAVNYQTRAIKMTASAQKETLKDYNERLRLYQAKTPYRTGSINTFGSESRAVSNR